MERIAEIKFRGKQGRLKATLPFKEGWLITLTAASMLLTDLLSLDEISFVLTRRLNQDPVEVSYTGGVFSP